MGTDWGLAMSVVAKGFTAVFLVLTILAFTVSLSSKIIASFEKKEQVKANS